MGAARGAKPKVPMRAGAVLRAARLGTGLPGRESTSVWRARAPATRRPGATLMRIVAGRGGMRRQLRRGIGFAIGWGIATAALAGCGATRKIAIGSMVPILENTAAAARERNGG